MPLTALAPKVVSQPRMLGVAPLTATIYRARWDFLCKAGWDGTCRQFVLKLDDLTVHRANFEFK